jgi:hypothetical protein
VLLHRVVEDQLVGRATHVQSAHDLLQLDGSEKWE